MDGGPQWPETPLCSFIALVSGPDREYNRPQGHEVTKKVVESQIYFDFQVATLCLDDNYAHSWRTFNQLHEVVTWKAFQLTGVPCLKVICEFISFLMRLSQSVVLCQGRRGIQKIALFGKRPNPFYGKNSSKRNDR